MVKIRTEKNYIKLHTLLIQQKKHGTPVLFLHKWVGTHPLFPCDLLLISYNALKAIELNWYAYTLKVLPINISITQKLWNSKSEIGMNKNWLKYWRIYLIMEIIEVDLMWEYDN